MAEIPYGPHGPMISLRDDNAAHEDDSRVCPVCLPRLHPGEGQKGCPTTGLPQAQPWRAR